MLDKSLLLDGRKECKRSRTAIVFIITPGHPPRIFKLRTASSVTEAESLRIGYCLSIRFCRSLKMAIEDQRYASIFAPNGVGSAAFAKLSPPNWSMKDEGISGSWICIVFSRNYRLDPLSLN